MNPEEVLDLARAEARASSYQRLQRSLPSADAHTTARARREYIDTLRAGVSRAIESIQEKENSMSKDQTSNQEHSDQEQEQHPTDRYPFPAHWPVTGPFANTDQE